MPDCDARRRHEGGRHGERRRVGDHRLSCRSQTEFAFGRATFKVVRVQRRDLQGELLVLLQVQSHLRDGLLQIMLAQGQQDGAVVGDGLFAGIQLGQGDRPHALVHVAGLGDDGPDTLHVAQRQHRLVKILVAAHQLIDVALGHRGGLPLDAGLELVQ